MTTEEHVKHTPGPWKAHTFDAAENKSQYVTAGVQDQIPICHTGRWDSSSAADATLIAAAPELLAEYQCLRNRVIAMRDAAYRLEHQGRNPNIGGFFREWLADDVLEGAAIAKANRKE